MVCVDYRCFPVWDTLAGQMVEKLDYSIKMKSNIISPFKVVYKELTLCLLANTHTISRVHFHIQATIMRVSFPLMVIT